MVLRRFRYFSRSLLKLNKETNKKSNLLFPFKKKKDLIEEFTRRIEGNRDRCVPHNLALLCPGYVGGFITPSPFCPNEYPH